RPPPDAVAQRRQQRRPRAEPDQHDRKHPAERTGLKPERPLQAGHRERHGVEVVAVHDEDHREQDEREEAAGGDHRWDLAIRPFPLPVRPELVEGPSFFFGAAPEGRTALRQAQGERVLDLAQATGSHGDGIRYGTVWNTASTCSIAPSLILKASAR